MSSSDFTLSRIEKANYRPSSQAEDFLDSLRTFVPGPNYRVARLAIARSLNEAARPALLEKDVEMADSSIQGSTLFGDDVGIWACMIVEASPEPVESLDAFKALVDAHWTRGAKLLQEDLERVDRRDADFAVYLAGLAGDSPEGRSADARGKDLQGSSVRLTVKLGEVGIDLRRNELVNVTLNEAGTSPHLALMGKVRSGKSRTGLSMAEQICQLARLPLIFIDPKGEFVKDGKFVSKSDWGGRTFGDRFPGAEPLDVPRRPIPLDFLALPPKASDADIAQVAISFRDSFQKCVRVKGDVAMDNLREVVEVLLRTRNSALNPSRGLSLEQVKDGIRDANEKANRKKDSVSAKLNELTSLGLFEPTLSPSEFFRRRWVIGLGAAPEEAKRLVMFLLMDALANYILSLEDSATDSSGCRAVRHLLAIDEANEILSFRHGALSRLIRRAASKGEIVMLLSQSPEDFDKEEDDFLSQMGTVAIFASSAQSVKSLRSVLGKKVQPEDFSDRELTRGVALVKAPHRDPTKVLAWR